jgi:hypothetical protein
VLRKDACLARICERYIFSESCFNGLQYWGELFRTTVDRRLKGFEPPANVLPNACLKALNAKNNIKQRASFEAERPRTGAQSPQVQKSERAADVLGYSTIQLIGRIVSGRVVRKRFEFIFLGVVTRDSQKPQRPNEAGAIGLFDLTNGEQFALYRIPPFEVLTYVSLA